MDEIIGLLLIIGCIVIMAGIGVWIWVGVALGIKWILTGFVACSPAIILSIYMIIMDQYSK